MESVSELERVLESVGQASAEGVCLAGNRFEPGQIPVILSVPLNSYCIGSLKTLRHRKEEKARIKHIAVKNPTETSTRCTYVDNERNKLHGKAKFFRILPETYTRVDKSEHCRSATKYKSVIDKPTLTVVFAFI